PALAPVRIDAPRTHAVVVARADEAVDDDAVRVDRQHLARLLADDALHAPEHTAATTAVVQHLAVEAKAARVVPFVERLEDLLLRLDLAQLARLQVHLFHRTLTACSTVEERVLVASVDQRVAREDPPVRLLQ